MIEVRGVSLVYGRGATAVPALEDISFSVEEGEMVALVGPSGCGKTSLLLLIDGLLQPSSGQVLIGGEEVRRVRRDVALILQDAGLLPWKTVKQNAELSLRIQKRREGVEGILTSLGLQGFERRFPAELSEGMRRRVGLARALALRPRVLLMDEPMANLDSLTRERIQNLLLDLWWEMRFTAILVTHDIEEAVFLGQRILVLTPRPARIREILDNPGMGSHAYRGSPEFLERVQALRRMLGENG